MTTNRPGTSDIAALRAAFEKHGQGHVFRFWDRLGPEERSALQRQAESIELAAILRGYAAVRTRSSSARPKLEPLEIITAPEHGGDAALHQAARRTGEALLREGRVGVMVVAGGQATRLGYPGPKGLFPIGPIGDRTLFELHAQKIRGLRRRCGRNVPWYVMTSQANDETTRSAFAAHGFFGLPEQDVFFLRQRMVPSFDFEGKLMLEHPGRIFENPDGHGGALTALLGSGALDDMEARGIDTLFYYQVDNPLVRIADPVFLGFHAEREAEVSCKAVRKTDPAEKVGVLARVNGKPGVVEYTEIDDDDRMLRDASGELVYWAGSIAVHVFQTAFIRTVAQDAERRLPFHVSTKRIPTVDANGETHMPDEPNGHKLERFVFDCLGSAERVCVLETLRHEEYSPLKNAEGSDSAATVHADLQACYRAWLDAAGIELPPPDATIEIDHSLIDGPEEARALGVRHTTEAADAIRVAPAGDNA